MKNEAIHPETATQTGTVITLDELYSHWQGHRGLTRRVIEAFPEDKLFTYSIGGMRPFSELAIEMITMTGPGVEGIVSREWKSYDEALPAKMPSTKEALLQLWDKTTEEINAYWPQVTTERLRETDKAFGQYENAVYNTLLYFIDNEIHHRGQGYVYLRSLNIEPPPFWDRK